MLFPLFLLLGNGNRWLNQGRVRERWEEQAKHKVALAYIYIYIYLLPKRWMCHQINSLYPINGFHATAQCWCSWCSHCYIFSHRHRCSFFLLFSQQKTQRCGLAPLGSCFRPCFVLVMDANVVFSCFQAAWTLRNSKNSS